MTGRELLAWLEQQSAERLDRPLYLIDKKRAFPVTKDRIVIEWQPPSKDHSL